MSLKRNRAGIREATLSKPDLVTSTEQIQVGPLKRSFLLVKGAPATKGAPAKADQLAAIVIVLHGSSQTGPKVRTFSGESFDALAADGTVAVVYPDGLKKLWNHAREGSRVTDDVAFMAALVDHFHALYGPIPVVIAGYSNGGQLLIRLIHEIPEKLYGAAIISATLPRPGKLDFSDKNLPLPVLLIHGTADFIVPYRGEGWLWGFWDRNRGPSAMETAQYFAARNGITAAPSQSALPHHAKSGKTRVSATSFQQTGRSPVTLYTVEGGGHVVPNPHAKAIFVLGRTTQDISAAGAVADFFPVLHR